MIDRNAEARVIEATFNPKRLDTLRPEAEPFIGKRLEWTRGWEIEDGDSSVYQGQVAWIPRRWEDREVGWIPSEDLEDQRPVDLMAATKDLGESIAKVFEENPTFARWMRFLNRVGQKLGL